jgi:hypothetical protein
MEDKQAMPTTPIDEDIILYPLEKPRGRSKASLAF